MPSNLSNTQTPKGGIIILVCRRLWTPLPLNGPSMIWRKKSKTKPFCLYSQPWSLVRFCYSSWYSSFSVQVSCKFFQLLSKMNWPRCMFHASPAFQLPVGFAYSSTTLTVVELSPQRLKTWPWWSLGLLSPAEGCFLCPVDSWLFGLVTLKGSGLCNPDQTASCPE